MRCNVAVGAVILLANTQNSSDAFPLISNSRALMKNGTSVDPWKCKHWMKTIDPVFFI